MLCLKAEALWGEMHASRAVLPVNLGSPIQRAMRRERRGSRGDGGLHPSSDPSPSSSSENGCSRSEESKSIHGKKEADWGGRVCCYRSQLEKEVKLLEKQLQEEIDLHVALVNALGNPAMTPSRSPSKLPNRAQELIASIDTLDMTVRKLEDELFALNLHLQHDRRERHPAQSHIEFLPVPSLEPPSNSSFNWEKHISSLRMSRSGGEIHSSIHLDVLLGSEDLGSVKGPTENIIVNELMGLCHGGEETKLICSSLHPPVDALKDLERRNLPFPNDLSEEMVKCMRNIFLRLARSRTSTSNSSKASLSEFLSSSSPAGKYSCSSLTSFSDSFRLPSSIQTSSELSHNYEVMDQEYLHDPYGVNERLNWRYIGKYSLATEVSWMSVGEAQLEYAAEALKNFRFLVEQLAKVNPGQMSSDEKLAFWINLYNALLMHAYLAYGFPRSDIKLFALMQKACYTIGGQAFNAADIEFFILKMKPPAHRPQIALNLAQHKFKMSEEHRKYSIDCSEPLALFALSCGMYSCPAVRIFTARNVREELKQSMKDYIQASVGINDKGKLLVPKLLYCFSKGVVEDSLLVDWISRHLTANQAAVVRNTTSLRKQRLLGARSFSITPFDSRFRYLFLPS